MQRSANCVDSQRENGPLFAEKSRGTSVSVDIENLDETWLDSINKKVGAEPKRLKTFSASDSCSIHRVPYRFRQHDEKALMPQIISVGPFHYDKRGDQLQAMEEHKWSNVQDVLIQKGDERKSVYVPRIISIGPFHYDKRKDQLQAMEEHKWRYLHDIRAQKGDNCLEMYLRAIKKLEKEARECYSEEVELDSNSFIEMLVLDGCFIIELFRREWIGEYEDDPIFELEWLKHALVIDLIMQENQIPFFILEHLSNLMDVSEPSPVEGALFFFEYWGFFKDLLPDIRISHPKPKIQHLLHLLHTNMVYTKSIYRLWNGETINMIPCASKLREAGIRFKRNGDHKFLDIKFQDGVIEIPPFIVEHMTYPIFFNLVAFEHSYRHCKKHITAYAHVMDRLINTARDVEILCPKIIDNWLSSDEEVAALFNNIGREIILDETDFYLSNVFNEINQHYGKFCPRMRAILKHDYCSTPCAIISIFAAIFLLLLTLGQAFFSAFPKFALQKKGN